MLIAVIILVVLVYNFTLLLHDPTAAALPASVKLQQASKLLSKLTDTDDIEVLLAELEDRSLFTRKEWMDYLNVGSRKGNDKFEEATKPTPRDEAVSVTIDVRTSSDESITEENLSYDKVKGVFGRTSMKNADKESTLFKDRLDLQPFKNPESDKISSNNNRLQVSRSLILFDKTSRIDIESGDKNIRKLDNDPRRDDKDDKKDDKNVRKYDKGARKDDKDTRKESKDVRKDDMGARKDVNDDKKGVQDIKMMQYQRKSWLFNNPKIKVNEVLTEDILPVYFELDADLLYQYEKHHNKTADIMKARVEHIRAKCAERPIYRQLKYKFFYYYPDFNLSWCPTFKCGSTNFRQFFCKTYFPDVYKNSLLDPLTPWCPMKTLSPFRKSSALNKTAWEQAFKKSIKFLTIRHPYERLISVYNNKYKNCASPNEWFVLRDLGRILEKYRSVPETFSVGEKRVMITAAKSECLKHNISSRIIDNKNPYMHPLGATFREFVHFITDNFRNGVYPDLHWAPISKSCDLCLTEFDVIEKFETLQRDHYFLFKKSGLTDRFTEISSSHSNPSGNSADLVEQYFSSLDETLLWDLQSVYWDDFNLFDYKPHFRILKNPRSGNSS